MPSQKIKVTIIEHKPSGMVVQTSPGENAWLPHREVSYEPDFNPRDVQSIRRAFPVNSEIEVLVIGHTVSERGLPVVSVAAARHDPWEHEVPQWVRAHEAKIMVVTNAGLRDFYRGQIQPGVEARIDKADLSTAFGDRAKDTFFVPRAGDRLAGVVVDADSEKRLVNLSAAQLFRGGNGSGPKGQLPVKIPPDRAFEILTDSKESALGALMREEGPPEGEDVGRPVVPPFARILVLDDRRDVAECLGDYLRVQGFEPVVCSKIPEAWSALGVVKDPSTSQLTLDPSLLPPDREPVGAALIDVNLEADPNDGKNGGIHFARELQRLYPSCRIVLITGETATEESLREKAIAAVALPVSGFLFKPVDGEELLECLSRARMDPPRDGHEVIQEQEPLGARSQAAKVLSKKKLAEDASQRYRETIERVLAGLGSGLGADSVFLFSMHPVTYDTEVVAQWGTPLANLDRFRNRLRLSPVGDVCLDSGSNAQGWCDDVRMCVGKHRYLLYCYSEAQPDCDVCKTTSQRVACPRHQYHSCAAIPVAGGRGNPLAYGLFAIAMEENAFDPTTVLPRMRLAAAEISAALGELRQEQVEAANFPFLMAGLSACMIGHDLCNYLQHGIDIDTALGFVERLRQGRSDQNALDGLRQVLSKAKVQLDLAHGVAKSFRDLSRDREEAFEAVPFLEILEGPHGARRVAHPEITAHRVAVHATLGDDRAQRAVIRVRKDAMVRVLQNLLNNSAQQIGQAGILPGAIRVDLAIKSRQDGSGAEREMLRVDVLDTGPGIHWAERKRIFEPRVTTRLNGSGMGLYIAVEEVERIGGSVEVADSVLGLGTKMRLWLPLADADNPATSGGGSKGDE